MVHQYLATVKPMHDAFVEPSKQVALALRILGTQPCVGLPE